MGKHANIKPEKHYLSLLDKYRKESAALQKKIFLISMLRFALFVIAAFTVFWFASHNSDNVVYALFAAIVMFLFLVKKHQKYFEDKRFNDLLIRINSEELAALKGNISAFDDGDEFLEKPEIHISDLDIFGKGSLFQKINRTATLGGYHRLALWLRYPFHSAGEIIKKQNVVDELALMPDFRQKFRAAALSHQEQRGDYVKLLRWLKSESYFSKHRVFAILSIIVPLVNFSLAVSMFFSPLFYKPAAVSYVLTLSFIGLFQKKINTEHRILTKRTKLLLKYTALLKSIEETRFKSLLLTDIQKALQKNKNKAWQRIEALAKILRNFDQRLNLLMGILLNVFLFWDIRNLIKIEKWKSENALEAVIWFNALGEVEAYCSLANEAFNNPQWIFPVPVVDKVVAAKDMRHPLMSFDECVPNDIDIRQEPYFMIVTGANMAGKSTYLRTVGTNLLLAMTGSKVNASSFEFSPVHLATSLRTNDSLLKNESYFYKELKRLQQIIQMLKEGKKTFVLLDEILKGTNSKDKESGSLALLKQLIGLNSSGIIATHDLNLAKAAQSLSPYAENFRFEAEINNDKLLFDYKLKKGAAQNLNATFLMKKMGIGI